NKIDRPHADPAAVHDQVLELFLELGATDEQFEAPFVYGSARDGYFMNSMEGEPPVDCTPLLFKIVEHIPAPKDADPEGEFKMLVSNIDWDDYVGRVAIGRITSGTVKKGDTVWLHQSDGSCISGKVTRMFEYSGLSTTDSAIGVAGNIVGVAGFENVNIGETLGGSADTEPLPFVAIDPPTISMEFSINNGPFGGRDGKNVTSRVIRDRLMREMRTNISIQVEDTDKAGVFSVSARGAMQIAVLVETMRRENYELCVSRPTVIMKRDENDRLTEPYETMYVEVPDEHANGVMKLLHARKGQMEDMVCREGTGHTFIQAYIPTRGIIGFEFELVNLTSGHGIFSHLFRDYGPYAGDITTRTTGTLVSMETGVSTPFALVALEERGRLFVGPQEDIYEGQIVGENPRQMDMPVNPCKEKHLNNIRSATKGDGIQLSPPVIFSLERAIEYIEPDELVEATPHFIRLRKRILNANDRVRESRKAGN
ncbi:MAG: EF-Tu/IF-2/RF-3 family GTPase, partial [Akkermansia muciniphila]